MGVSEEGIIVCWVHDRHEVTLAGGSGTQDEKGT